MRDTDRDWQTIGETEPFFGVLTDPRFRREALTAAALEDFYASGHDDIQATIARVRQHVAPDFFPERGLDFGCGAGRLTLAMRSWCSHVIGVDISLAMIAEGQRRQQSLGLGGVEWRDNLQVDPVDWVNTHIVLQHIPPERGFSILQTLLGLLAHKGIATIQLAAWRTAERLGGMPDYLPLRYDGRSSEFLGDIDGPPSGTMVMYDYDMTRVLAAFVHAGIGGMWLEHTDHDGHHGFQIIGQKLSMSL